MRTIKLTISYDGTDFVGWQNQPNGVSVQECLERALGKMTGTPCQVTGAGRTDSGVHAIGQAAHFKTETDIPCHGFVGGLNSLLPESIVITSADDVEGGFHARRDAKAKIYRYEIACSLHRAPLLVNRCWHVRETLDLDAMRKASKYLIGQHDFESFRAAGCGSRNAIREIRRIEMSEAVIARSPPTVFGGRRSNPRSYGDRHAPLRWARDDNESNLLSIEFEGDGFVRHMIRNIVGTLVDIGAGKIAPEEMQTILNARQREKAGRCAPAFGLYLVQVIY
ncbi:MAG: tRNA pseudouridine(38-40) synthase TruA [Pseudomonadota bacterium]